MIRSRVEKKTTLRDLGLRRHHDWDELEPGFEDIPPPNANHRRANTHFRWVYGHRVVKLNLAAPSRSVHPAGSISELWRSIWAEIVSRALGLATSPKGQARVVRDADPNRLLENGHRRIL